MNEKIENQVKELSKEEMEYVQGGTVDVGDYVLWARARTDVSDTPVYQPPRATNFFDQVFDW